VGRSNHHPDIDRYWQPAMHFAQRKQPLGQLPQGDFALDFK